MRACVRVQVCARMCACWHVALAGCWDAYWMHGVAGGWLEVAVCGCKGIKAGPPGASGAALPPLPLASGFLAGSFLGGGAALAPLAGFSGGGGSGGVSTGSAGGFIMTFEPPTSSEGNVGYSPVSGSRPSRYHLLIFAPEDEHVLSRMIN